MGWGPYWGMNPGFPWFLLIMPVLCLGMMFFFYRSGFRRDPAEKRHPASRKQVPNGSAARLGCPFTGASACGFRCPENSCSGVPFLR